MPVLQGQENLCQYVSNSPLFAAKLDSVLDFSSDKPKFSSGRSYFAGEGDWILPLEFGCYLRILAQGGYNSRMKGVSASRISFTAGERTIAVVLVVALILAHPVPARDLHFCSQAGELVRQGHGCLSSAVSGSCCAGQPAPRSHSCCPGAEEKKEIPEGGPCIASPPCSDCCREYSLAGIGLLIAFTPSSTGDVETALQDLSYGPVELLTLPAPSASSRSTAPPDLSPARAIYLFACRFLI